MVRAFRRWRADTDTTCLQSQSEHASTSGQLQLFMMKASTKVPAIEMMIDPRHPVLFEKKANMNAS
jgi:hypothetical protein